MRTATRCLGRRRRKAPRPSETDNHHRPGRRFRHCGAGTGGMTVVVLPPPPTAAAGRGQDGNERQQSRASPASRREDGRCGDCGRQHCWRQDGGDDRGRRQRCRNCHGSAAFAGSTDCPAPWGASLNRARAAPFTLVANAPARRSPGERARIEVSRSAPAALTPEVPGRSMSMAPPTAPVAIAATANEVARVLNFISASSQ